MINLGKSEVTLLTHEQVSGKNEIKSLRKIDLFSPASDFAVLLGSETTKSYVLEDDESLKGRLTDWSLKTPAGVETTYCVNRKGKINELYSKTSCGVRPVISFSDETDIIKNAKKVKKGILEIEYGEYPQYAPEIELSKYLDEELVAGKLKKTGKVYKTLFESETIYHYEYEFKGKKYVKTDVRLYSGLKLLSNGKQAGYKFNEWVEVKPITWIVDLDAKLLISKIVLADHIDFCEKGSRELRNFNKTPMYRFLNSFFAKDIIPKSNINFNDKNDLNLVFDEVSEEDIIKGAILSDVAVFLHGLSSEGKSSRVKEIDPDCVIVYLRNTSPDVLNGKSVFNNTTGEMIDIKPSWLQKLEKKCVKEPNKLHILFFDEITNALPSVQGMAFNIILNKEVNGMWQLPKNARIVAAGNEMEESLAAFKMAEPLFNRFAHVYIKTTPDMWLSWASEHNIHPAIYTFIAYGKDAYLRSKYNGKEPNADPRKWEMASNLLYKNESIEMLRSLVGEDITKDFMDFCKKRKVKIFDILNNFYDDKSIDEFDDIEKYASLIDLSQVGEEHLKEVRDFVKKFGDEYIIVFDNLWTHGDKDRLNKLEDVRLSKVYEKIGGKYGKN